MSQEASARLQFIRSPNVIRQHLLGHGLFSTAFQHTPLQINVDSDRKTVTATLSVHRALKGR